MRRSRAHPATAAWPEAGAPRRVHVVSHTHWDREWYRTFDEFRLGLSEVIGQVLDRLDSDEAFRHFVLDGQAILLDDHLARHPDDEARIRRHVTSGRLAVGPWYILPDEFLVSGESTVRNLELGHRTAARFGPVQTVGYMPDSFGHLAQIPQLLRGAGLDSFLYTRGNGDEIDRLGAEYIWRGPDGSEVLAIHQIGGYCNAASLGHEEIWHAHTQRRIDPDLAVEQVRRRFEEMRGRSRTDVVLLNNGCDHFPPQRDLGRVMAALGEAFPETEFVHSDLQSYVAEVAAAGCATEVHEGELLGGRLHHILSGVWSARTYLKQWNERCENLLTARVEPFLAYARFVLGVDYPVSTLDHTWRLLLENHPHDSICGCSIDAVHGEMVTRFDKVARTGEELLRRGLERIAPTFAGVAEDDAATWIAVVNSLPFRRTEIVERLVVLQPPGIDPGRLELTDEQGRRVPFEIVQAQHVERFWGIDYRKQLSGRVQREQFDVYRRAFGERILRDADRASDSDLYLTLRFEADLPAVGHAGFRLGQRAAGPGPGLLSPTTNPVVTTENTIDNGRLSVRLHPDGRFDLDDRETGREWPGLNALEDTEDVGDEYDHSPSAVPGLFTPDPRQGRVESVTTGTLAGRLCATFPLTLPAGIAPDRRSRLSKRVECPVTVTVELRAGCPWVEVECEIDNRVEDHRLRACFPTGIDSEELGSEGAFLLHRRPAVRSGGEDWVQPAPPTWPQQGFSFVEDVGQGLALFNRGLPEIQAIPGSDGLRLALTLLRAVGWLSRDDFPTRRNQNAGPTLPTPGAQCPGTHRFRYAVAPFRAGSASSCLPPLDRRYRNPPFSIQGVEDGFRPGGSGLLEQRGGTTITGIHRHLARDTLIVRLYNPAEQAIHEELRFGPAIVGCWRNDLIGGRLEPQRVRDEHVVALEVAPRKIVTLELAFVPAASGSGRRRSPVR